MPASANEHTCQEFQMQALDSHEQLFPGKPNPRLLTCVLKDPFVTTPAGLVNMLTNSPCQSCLQVHLSGDLGCGNCESLDGREIIFLVMCFT